VSDGTDDMPAEWRKMAHRNWMSPDLLEDLRRYVAGSLPTHIARGGEADRQRLLRCIDEVLNAN
jgi:hypothetical protein